MNKAKLTEFEKLLISEREAVQECFSKLDGEERTLYGRETGEPGLRTPSEVLEQITDSDENFLEKIDLALERIENETYGICVGCGHEIPDERLRAKPSVSLCHDCQRKHEDTLKPKSDPTYSAGSQR